MHAVRCIVWSLSQTKAGKRLSRPPEPEAKINCRPKPQHKRFRLPPPLKIRSISQPRYRHRGRGARSSITTPSSCSTALATSGASAGGTDGLFHRDTRFLSRLQLLLNDAQPLLLGSNLRDDNAALVVDLTNPDVYRGSARRPGEGHAAHPAHHLPVARTPPISGSACAITATGRSRCACRSCSTTILPICSRCAARIASGAAPRPTQLRGNDQVLLNYHGLDDKLRRTTLTFDPPPDKLATNGAIYNLQLAPGEARPIFLAAGCNQAEPRPLPFLRAHRSRRAASCAKRRAAAPASRPRTNSSTRCCAGRRPTSKC